MEIETIKYKQKITRSIINQMPHAKEFQIKNGTCIGHINNIVKNQNKTLLIKSNELLYLLPADYKMSNIYNCSFTRLYGKNKYHFTFNSEEMLEEYWGYYQERIKEGAKQIYI